MTDCEKLTRKKRSHCPRTNFIFCSFPVALGNFAKWFSRSLPNATVFFQPYHSIVLVQIFLKVTARSTNSSGFERNRPVHLVSKIIPKPLYRSPLRKRTPFKPKMRKMVGCVISARGINSHLQGKTKTKHRADMFSGSALTHTCFTWKSQTGEQSLDTFF